METQYEQLGMDLSEVGLVGGAIDKRSEGLGIVAEMQGVIVGEVGV